MKNKAIKQLLPAPPEKENWIDIPLDAQPYTLTITALDQVSSHLAEHKAKFERPSMNFISLENKILELESRHKNQWQTIKVRLDPDLLSVSCCCGEAARLCLHAWEVLFAIAQKECSNFILDFSPNGHKGLAMAEPVYFKISKSRYSISVTQAPELGRPYLPNKLSAEQALTLPGGNDEANLARQGEALAYLVDFSFRKERTPYPIPVLGKLSKTGEAIVSFGNFLTGVAASDAPYLSKRERQLNDYSLELLKLAEHLPGSLLKLSPEQTADYERVFTLWQQVWPLLALTSFTYAGKISKLKELQGKPRNYYFDRFKAKHEKLTLFFELADRGDLYQLSLKVKAGDKILEEPDLSHLLVVKQENDYWLLNSLGDASIVEWMYCQQNCLSIFKQHFASFEMDILYSLQQYYTVKRTTKAKIKPDWSTKVLL